MGSDSSSGNTNYTAEWMKSMSGLGVSAASASQAISSATRAFSQSTVTARGFPSPDEALDHAMMMDKAMTWLREGEGPPDAIRVLADERAKELDVQVRFAREVAEDGELIWQVEITTKRGTLRAYPYLSDKERVELAVELLPTVAWKNAMRDVGLL